MDFIEIAIILMLCVLSFVVGQKFTNPKSPAALKNDKYKKLPESYEEDEEVFDLFSDIIIINKKKKKNAFPLMDTQETMQKNLKGQQKEVDKLLQEIEDLKNKEKKHIVEIEYLKSQLAKQVHFLKKEKLIFFFF